MFQNYDKDNLYDEIKDFIKEHSIGELFEILKMVFEQLEVEHDQGR